MLSKSVVFEIFQQSGLEADELSKIWNLLDIDENEKEMLTVTKFCVAMGLLYKRSNGVQLPEHLPDELVSHLNGDEKCSESFSVVEESDCEMSSESSSPWLLTDNEKIHYNQIFNAWIPLGTDFIDFYRTYDIVNHGSGIWQGDFLKIWNLVDASKSDRINIAQFRVIMGLVCRFLRGFAIPGTIPPELKAVVPME